MDNLSPTGIPLMIVGFTTLPVPFPISAIGLTSDPTCLATVTLDALAGPLATAGSTASLSLPMPAAPAIAGTMLFFQGAQLEITTGDWSLTDEGAATLGF